MKEGVASANDKRHHSSASPSRRTVHSFGHGVHPSSDWLRRFRVDGVAEIVRTAEDWDLSFGTVKSHFVLSQRQPSISKWRRHICLPASAVAATQFGEIWTMARATPPNSIFSLSRRYVL